jgi:hypothetical protein
MKRKRQVRRKPRKRAIRKFKANLTYLRAHERRVIMNDIMVLIETGPISVSRLDALTPGRYDLRLLKAALKRFHEQERTLRLVTKRREFGYGIVNVYTLREPIQRAA